MSNSSETFSYKSVKKRIPKLYPYSIEVPHGVKTYLQEYCTKKLGAPYIRWYGFAVKQFHPRYEINENAQWAYNSDDGKLYVSDERNLAMVTMAVLTKPGKEAKIRT